MRDGEQHHGTDVEAVHQSWYGRSRLRHLSDGEPRLTVPSLDAIQRRVVSCTRCPELRAYCAQVGRVKRRAFAAWEYWAKPVPAWGDPHARLLVVGLAPGAHGSNRTGRPFTGDGSGVWLYRALHRAGYANQPEARDRDDGLRLDDCFVTAVVRCAPPANKPTTEQRDRCLPYLEQELAALPRLRVIVTLGKFADDAVHGYVKRAGRHRGARAAFGHGAQSRVDLPGLADVAVLASYHPSRQNTQTRLLTEPMLDAVFARARTLSGAD